MNNKYKDRKKYTPKQYRDIFQDILRQEIPILNTKGEQLIIGQDEIFCQCYAPDDEARRLLPPFWFMSEELNVIDIANPSNPQWRNKYYRKESKSYFYAMPTELPDGRIISKSIEVHNLSAIVFGSTRFGAAQKMLEDKGLLAFGVKNKSNPSVNGHHQDLDKTNNHYSNIELVSTDVHSLMHNAPRDTDNDQEQIDFMRKFSHLMDIESPDKINVLVESPQKSIVSVSADSPFIKSLTEYLNTHKFAITRVEGKHEQIK